MLINDLSGKINKYRNTIDSATKRVLNRSHFILGPEVKSFEQAFAEYHNVEFCLTVANGTDALEIGLRAIGIEQGDKVATAANAGFYSTTAILGINAAPLYLDVDVQTRVVTVAEVNRAILEGAKAIIVTHLFGQAIPDIIEIATLCKSNSIPLIEDCAQSHGAKINNKYVGSFGDIGCFSFYPTKNLGALGDGGAVITDNSELAEKVKAFRQYGWSEKYKVDSLGRNSRLDELQAAILNEFLPFLDEWNIKRREIALEYSKKIIHPYISHPVVGEDDYVAHLYVINTSRRSELQKHLQAHNIGSDIHYPIPDTRQNVFNNQYQNTFLPNTEKLSTEILTIPCYPEMPSADIQKVIDVINNWEV